jgi:proteasome alpha subunit
MPIYASPEQFMRDRSDYARKGIGRGRSVVVTTYSDGVLFVAENNWRTLHKVSEIYDRIGFAAVGRYNEFENLRTAGIRLADVRGYSYDRRDVTGRWLANAYAQTLGSIFSEHQKPFEVELCVAEVARPNGDADPSSRASAGDQLYRISYDGSIVDEPRFVVMGGVTDPVTESLEGSFAAGWDLASALSAAVVALGAAGEGAPRDLGPGQLEVAVLERFRAGRTFRRLDDAEVAEALAAGVGDEISGTGAAGDGASEPDSSGDSDASGDSGDAAGGDDAAGASGDGASGEGAGDGGAGDAGDVKSE